MAKIKFANKEQTNLYSSLMGGRFEPEPMAKGKVKGKRKQALEESLLPASEPKEIARQAYEPIFADWSTKNLDEKRAGLMFYLFYKYQITEEPLQKKNYADLMDLIRQDSVFYKIVIEQMSKVISVSSRPTDGNMESKVDEIVAKGPLELLANHVSDGLTSLSASLFIAEEYVAGLQKQKEKSKSEGGQSSNAQTNTIPDEQKVASFVLGEFKKLSEPNKSPSDQELIDSIGLYLQRDENYSSAKIYNEDKDFDKKVIYLYKESENQIRYHLFNNSSNQWEPRVTKRDSIRVELLLKMYPKFEVALKGRLAAESDQSTVYFEVDEFHKNVTYHFYADSKWRQEETSLDNCPQTIREKITFPKRILSDKELKDGIEAYSKGIESYPNGIEFIPKEKTLLDIQEDASFFDSMNKNTIYLKELDDTYTGTDQRFKDKVPDKNHIAAFIFYNEKWETIITTRDAIQTYLQLKMYKDFSVTRDEIPAESRKNDVIYFKLGEDSQTVTYYFFANSQWQSGETSLNKCPVAIRTAAAKFNEPTARVSTTPIAPSVKGSWDNDSVQKAQKIIQENLPTVALAAAQKVSVDILANGNKNFSKGNPLQILSSVFRSMQRTIENLFSDTGTKQPLLQQFFKTNPNAKLTDPVEGRLESLEKEINDLGDEAARFTPRL
jgi:hypothetical protein